MTFKLATWNVNSIRIRLDLLKKLAETEQPDIICLQGSIMSPLNPVERIKQNCKKLIINKKINYDK